MNRHYTDLLALSPEPPKWFDENAVPRFCEFSHEMCANIYADEIVLMLIQCQECSREFQVCMSRDIFHKIRHGRLETEIDKNEIHYGDPPNVQCCPGGPSMNSIPIRILQYWRAPTALLEGEWTRDSSLEVAIKHDGMEDEEP